MFKYEVYLRNGKTIVVYAKRMIGEEGFVQFIGDIPEQGEGLVAFFLDAALIGVKMVNGGSDAEEDCS